MKISKLEFGATIPTQQYGNIQPKIELIDTELREGIDVGMNYLREMYARFSSSGALVEKDITIKGVSKSSFNEEGITVEYEPIAHSYLYEEKTLVSATQFIKQFYKEFDLENISKASAKAWGVEQQDVKDMWKYGGELTSDFGTLVHKALETYDRYGLVGQAIQTKKELDENYAMPKHPILKKIVKDFLVIDKVNGEVIPEVLITDVKNGYCGHADRIIITDSRKKICRVQDYKVNIGSEEIKSDCKALAPFDKLPANKITKYQLQMSFYANMLQASGWTVEGLDVYVYEDEWKHYPLEVLKVV